jgi:putative DNA modification/repair radical SAM protein
MTTLEKLTILTDAAKYDVACTSSGADRGGESGKLGSAVPAGICHTFAADGRCVSLLKVLYTNSCIYDCKYCVNRRSHDTPRTAFTPRELAELTIGFYRRNYIEGLFLSSGILKNPDYTCEQLIQSLSLLRNEYGFRGYIHAKAIPGADPLLISRLGALADRMSVNIELPSEQSLKLLAPDKTRTSIFTPMGLISGKIAENSKELTVYKHAPKFAPAGQSTQMIIGATPDSDYKILKLTEGLYHKYKLKRVFFSAYMPVSENALLPPIGTKPPLLREHRLYQADWLLRFYGFSANELLDEQNQSFHPLVDPKCSWALNHMEFFPVEINSAPYETLLRIPGIGVKSARRIMQARRAGKLDFDGLKRLGVVLKRAQYFVVCSGKILQGLKISQDAALRALISEQGQALLPEQSVQQLSFFDTPSLMKPEAIKCLTKAI